MRKTRAREDLGVGLKENSFVRFHVKKAAQEAGVQAADKGLKEPPVGDEWRFINFDEITQVMKVSIQIFGLMEISFEHFDYRKINDSWNMVLSRRSGTRS